jgi:hypothetical protein
MRIRIYTNDREQPIVLDANQIRTQVPEIRTTFDDEQGVMRERSNVDQTVREIIKNGNGKTAPDLLFTTEEGVRGAVYLNPKHIAAVITSWKDSTSTQEAVITSWEESTSTQEE